MSVKLKLNMVHVMNVSVFGKKSIKKRIQTNRNLMLFLTCDRDASQFRKFQPSRAGKRSYGSLFYSKEILWIDFN